MKTKLFFTFLLAFSLNSVIGQSYYPLKVKKAISSESTSHSTNEKKNEKKIFFKIDPESSDSAKVHPVQFAIGNGDLNGQIYTEFLTDYFQSKNNKYLGHISVGTVLTNAKNDSSNTINNFFNGGGNLFLKYAFVTDFGNDDGDDNFTFKNIFSLRPSANLPELKKGQVAFSDWNFEIADEFTISLLSKNNAIGLYLKPKVAIAYGGKSFLNTILEANENNSKTKKSFTYFQMSSALKLSNKYLINLAFKPQISGKLNKATADKNWTTIGVQALF